MQYKNIPGLKMDVSQIIYGCATQDMLAGRDAFAVLDEALAEGINAFDTAENYGQSEEALGRWIDSRSNRDRLLIITKGCHPYGSPRVNPTELRKDLDKSFVRLRTDYIDMYLLHRDDPSQPVGPLVEVLNEYHAKGKIGAFGGSNWTHARIAEANVYAEAHGMVPFTLSSPNYSMAVQMEDMWGGGVTITGAENAGARAWYLKNQMPVLAHSGLGRGFLSGRVRSTDADRAADKLDRFAVKGYCYPDNFRRLARAEQLAAEKNATVPQIALAWLLSQPLNVFPIASTSRPEAVAQNLRALDIHLSAAECAWLNLESEVRS